MRGDELAVEQFPAARAEPRDEVRERDLRGVARAADHRFAEKGAAERDAVEPARELAVQPAFDAVRMAELEQTVVARADYRIDPRRRPVVGGRGAERDHIGKGGVGRDAEAVGHDDFFQAVRQVEVVERQDRAQPRFDPMDRRVIRPVGHRKNALRIGAQKQRRVYGFEMLQDAGFTNFSVMRSDSPIATYLARSVSPSVRFGGSVQTPLG